MKIGRNDPCPCGSGVKYKRCCLGRSGGSFPPFFGNPPVVEVDPSVTLQNVARAEGFTPEAPSPRRQMLLPLLFGDACRDAMSDLLKAAMGDSGGKDLAAAVNQCPFAHPLLIPSRGDFTSEENTWALTQVPFSGVQSLSDFWAKRISHWTSFERKCSRALQEGEFVWGHVFPVVEEQKPLTMADFLATFASNPAVSALFDKGVFLEPSRALSPFLGFRPHGESATLFATHFVKFSGEIPWEMYEKAREDFALAFVMRLNGVRFVFNCPGRFQMTPQTFALLASFVKKERGKWHQCITEIYGIFLKKKVWQLLLCPFSNNAWRDLGSEVTMQIWASDRRNTAKARCEQVVQLLKDSAKDCSILEEFLRALPQSDESQRLFIEAWDSARVRSQSPASWAPEGGALVKILCPEKKTLASPKLRRESPFRRVRRTPAEIASLSKLQLALTATEIENHIWRRIHSRGLGISAPVVIVDAHRTDDVVAWDAFTRTLTLPLAVLSQSWSTLCQIGVWALCHMLSDTYKSAGTPEAQAYEMAWNRLALEPRLRISAHNMTSIPKEWRESLDNGSDEEKRFLEKVDKLFSLAQSSNEHEAALAMQKAQDLLAGRTISRHKCGLAGSKDLVMLTLELEGKRIDRTFAHISSLLVKHYLVRIINAQCWDPGTNGWRPALHILGRRENVLMAEHVFDFLAYKIESLWQSTRKQQGMKAGAKLSYQLGLIHGFHKKLDDMVAHRAKGDEVHALVPLEKRDVDAYVNELFPDLTNRSTPGYCVEESAFAQGKNDGNDIVIHAPIRQGGKDDSKERLKLT